MTTLLERFRPAAKRPAAPPPQTLEEARATLQRLREAGAAVRERVLADPEMVQAHTPTPFVPGENEKFVVLWARDVETCLREARASEPLSILQCEPGRADRALNGIDAPYPEDRRPGAIAQQGKIVADLEAKEKQAEYDAAAVELRGMDVDFARLLLKARDLRKARIAKAAKLWRPAGIGTQPRLKVLADVTPFFLALDNVKSPEDLV